MGDTSIKQRPFSSVAQSVTIDSMKEVYTILADAESKALRGRRFAYDSLPEVAIVAKDTARIRELMYGQVKANMVTDGVSFESVSEMKERMRFKIETKVQDSYYNGQTGVGIQGMDPSMNNTSDTPVSMSPNEATSYYSNGGLPQIIIDKKSKGAQINGYHFESTCVAITDDDKKLLLEYANKVGFGSALEQATRDGLIYGGAALFPKFKKDTPDSMVSPLNMLVDDGTIDKDCIDYFVVVDRWNTVMIPSYNITARDYLTPDTFYVPLGGLRVSTRRCALVRPKKLPYWGALRQLGWGASDFEGYIRSLMAYKITIMTVPIMAQQMSLLVHEIPLDGVVAMNGTDSAKEFVAANSAMLRSWSMINPITVNSFGKLSAINRSFTDFSDLVTSLKQDVASNSGIPESVLFHTMPTGFADNTEEITLKQSETIKNISNAVVPSMKPIVKMLVYACFGRDSEQARYADTFDLSFESPSMITNEERGKLLEKFSMAVNAFNKAGATISDAVKMATVFMPEMKMPTDVMERLRDVKPVEQPNPFADGSSAFGGPDGEGQTTPILPGHPNGNTSESDNEERAGEEGEAGEGDNKGYGGHNNHNR